MLPEPYYAEGLGTVANRVAEKGYSIAPIIDNGTEADYTDPDEGEESPGNDRAIA